MPAKRLIESAMKGTDEDVRAAAEKLLQTLNHN
jgi:hypothetical protein